MADQQSIQFEPDHVGEGNLTSESLIIRWWFKKEVICDFKQVVSIEFQFYFCDAVYCFSSDGWCFFTVRKEEEQTLILDQKLNVKLTQNKLSGNVKNYYIIYNNNYYNKYIIQNRFKQAFTLRTSEFEFARQKKSMTIHSSVDLYFNYCYNIVSSKTNLKAQLL